MKLPAVAFVIQSDVLKVAHHAAKIPRRLIFPRPSGVVSPSSRQAKKIPMLVWARNFLNAWGKLAFSDRVRTLMAQFTPLRTKTDGSIFVSLGAREVMAQANSRKVPPPQNQEHAQQQ